MKTKYDTAVIGGGLAGFIAAIKAAEGGQSVVLLEKSNRFGGRAMTNRTNGVHLNMGGHALYKAGRGIAILKELGIRLEGGKPSANVNVLWNDRLVMLGSDPVRMLASKLLPWSGKMQLIRLFMKLMRLNTNTIPAQSVREWAEGDVKDPMVRHIFYALSRTATYVSDPDHQLAKPALAQIQRSLKGVLYVNGGWQTIIDQLKDRAQKAGVTIVSGKHVTAIQHEGGKVRGLLLADDTTISVANVICTASPSECFKLVPGAEFTSLQRWASEAKPATAACLDVGLRELPVPENEVALGLDQPIFFSNHSVNAKMSDNGSCVFHLVKYNRPGENDPKAAERLLFETMNRLQPGWESKAVAKQFLPSIPVTQGYPHINQSTSVIGPDVPEIQGLYVAGDWVSHGELLADASAASAVRAAEAIVHRSSAARMVAAI